jgi:hypothetical protein
MGKPRILGWSLPTIQGSSSKPRMCTNQGHPWLTEKSAVNQGWEGTDPANQGWVTWVSPFPPEEKASGKSRRGPGGGGGGG